MFSPEGSYFYLGGAMDSFALGFGEQGKITYGRHADVKASGSDGVIDSVVANGMTFTGPQLDLRNVDPVIDAPSPEPVPQPPPAVVPVPVTPPAPAPSPQVGCFDDLIYQVSTTSTVANTSIFNGNQGEVFTLASGSTWEVNDHNYRTLPRNRKTCVLGGPQGNDVDRLDGCYDVGNSIFTQVA